MMSYETPWGEYITDNVLSRVLLKDVPDEHDVVLKDMGESGGLRKDSLPGGRYVIPMAWCKAETSLFAGIQAKVTSPPIPMDDVGGRRMR